MKESKGEGDGIFWREKSHFLRLRSNAIARAREKCAHFSRGERDKLAKSVRILLLFSFSLFLSLSLKVPWYDYFDTILSILLSPLASFLFRSLSSFFSHFNILFTSICYFETKCASFKKAAAVAISRSVDSYIFSWTVEYLIVLRDLFFF